MNRYGLPLENHLTSELRKSSLLDPIVCCVRGFIARLVLFLIIQFSTKAIWKEKFDGRYMRSC
jgi:hypothetical protein